MSSTWGEIKLINKTSKKGKEKLEITRPMYVVP